MQMFRIGRGAVENAVYTDLEVEVYPTQLAIRGERNGVGFTHILKCGDKVVGHALGGQVLHLTVDAIGIGSNGELLSDGRDANGGLFNIGHHWPKLIEDNFYTVKPKTQKEAVAEWAKSVGFDYIDCIVEPMGSQYKYESDVHDFDVIRLRVDLSAIDPTHFMNYTLRKIAEYHSVHARNELRARMHALAYQFENIRSPL